MKCVLWTGGTARTVIMAITLGSNIASLRTQRQLFTTENLLSRVFERLSSGQRINSAADDAAGLAISEGLNTDRRVYTQGIRNFNDGLSLLNIADSAVENLTQIVTRIQELATQAANGSLSNEQREALDVEAQELRKEFFRISRETEFNGLRLFDGTLENGVRLQGGYGIDGSLFSSLGGALADGTFSQEAIETLGVSADGGQVADFDGDGNLDLVVATSSGSLNIYYGDGTGSFSGEASFAIMSGVSELQLGDVNNDGLVDIIAIDPGSSNDANVQLFTNSGTSFDDQGIILSGVNAYDIAFGDFDGNGTLDLATAGSDNVAIYSGSGQGSFNLTSSYAISSGFGGELLVGDIDNDGNVDVFVSARTSGLFASQLILSGNGDGTLQSAVTVSTLNTNGESALGDIDGDGDLDLLLGAANQGGYVQNNGDGTFASIVTFALDELLNDAYIADINGDGHADLIFGGSSVAPSGGSLSVRFGNGDGTFSDVQTQLSGSTRINDLRLADFNNDGVLDFVSVEGTSARMYLGGSREGINPLLEFSLKTQADALQALSPLEDKLNALSSQRGVIGSFQSRLGTALRTLEATNENYAAAESRIRDADLAFEAAELTRLSILRLAASSVLAQANQQSAVTLALLA